MFANSLRLIDECDIVHGHIFPYSPARRHARRAHAAGRAATIAKAPRRPAARSQCRGRRHAWLEALVGKTANMLVESDGDTGHADNFARVTLIAPADPRQIVRVRHDRARWRRG